MPYVRSLRGSTIWANQIHKLGFRRSLKPTASFEILPPCSGRRDMVSHASGGSKDELTFRPALANSYAKLSLIIASWLTANMTNTGTEAIDLKANVTPNCHVTRNNVAYRRRHRGQSFVTATHHPKELIRKPRGARSFP